MHTLENSSLGQKISQKMSGWITVLTLIITIGAFAASYVLSRQMFNKQVATWTSVIPQYLLINLIDSDNFAINREVKLLQSTGLFSSFLVMDNRKREVASFGSRNTKNEELIAIKDEAKIIWGYYAYGTNFTKFFSPFLISTLSLTILILFFYFAIRIRIKFTLGNEFTKFNQFLKEVENVAERMSELYDESGVEKDNAIIIRNSEQEIINRSVSRLVDEIRNANRKLKVVIQESEKKKYQEELTRTALQVAHDIGSPLAALEMVVYSNSLNIPEHSRIAVRNAAARIRAISNSLLNKGRISPHAENDEVLRQHQIYNLVKFCVEEKIIQYRKK